MGYMFGGCGALTSLDLSGFDTSNVTMMYEMFCGCVALTSLDLSNFNTSNVTRMYGMFDTCIALTSLDLSSFDTSNAEDMWYMFRGCGALTSLDLSSFNTSNVTSMYEMFRDCKALTSLNLSSFNTSNVTNMMYMFDGCSKLTSLDLSGFDTSKVTNMVHMFEDCKALTSLNLSSFNTSNITSMIYMFSGCSSLTSLNLSSFNTSNVFSMYDVFRNCRTLTSLDLSGFDTSKVNSMNEMFYGCSALTSLNLSSFDTSNVTDMGGMFYGCIALTSLDLSSFDTSNVTTMYEMFDTCNALTSLDLSGFDTSKVAGMWYMFRNCRALTSLNLSSFNTSNVTYMYSMFRNCVSLTSLNLSSFDTSKVWRMDYMFCGCNSLTSLDLSGFDTSVVFDMSYMFRDCVALTSLNLSSFNTSNVTNMIGMFYYCKSLTSLDVSGFNTSKVESMNGMFYDCRALTSLDVSGFDISNTTDIAYMFRGCQALVILYHPLFTTNGGINDIFAVTASKTYLITKGTASSAVIQFWKTIASVYVNVHYEFDDNPVPSLSNFTITRVASDGSTTYSETGTYAYLKVNTTIKTDFLPPIYTNTLKELNLSKDGSAIQSTWTESSPQTTPPTMETWINIADTRYNHIFELTASDSIKNNGVEIGSRTSAPLSMTLQKVYALFDIVHDVTTNTEGLTIGGYATLPGQFEVGLPSNFYENVIFKSGVVVERLVGEIKMWAGNTAPNGWLECDGSAVSRTAYPMLFSAIGTLWGAGDGSTTFNLPNLQGRTPVGASSSTFEWVTIIGEGGGTFVIDSPTYARFGDPVTDAWVYATIDAGTYTATYADLVPSIFPSDPAPGAAKTIQVQLNVGSTAGTSEQLLTVAEMPSHNHTQNSHGHSLTNASYFLYNTSEVNRKTVKSGSGASNMLHSDGATSRPGSAAVGNTATNNASGGGKIHSQMQPFAVVKYIICAA